jgi:hypothetical protein
MIDFLLQDGVCECLVGFITQISPGALRCNQRDPPTEALKLSYRFIFAILFELCFCLLGKILLCHRAVALLSPEKPSDALNAFLAKKAEVIAREIFDVRLRADKS